MRLESRRSEMILPRTDSVRAQGRGREPGCATARQVLRELYPCLEWHHLDASSRCSATRAHVRAALVALTLGVALLRQWTWTIILAIVAVIAAEMINTVAEAIVDLVTETYHLLAKIAKDVAAGAVLWSAIGAVVVGIVIFGPHLLFLLTHFLSIRRFPLSPAAVAV